MDAGAQRAVRNSVSPIEEQVFSGLHVEGAARGGSVTVHVFGEDVLTKTEDVKVGSVKADFRPAVPVRALFGVQESTWGIVSINTDGSINVIHRWGGDSATWALVDISLTYTT